eukprot:14256114-Heterocapsa_arctica.AAC.2
MRGPGPPRRGLPSLAGAGTGHPRPSGRGAGDAAISLLPAPPPGGPVGFHVNTAPEARRSRSPRGRPTRLPGRAAPLATS